MWSDKIDLYVGSYWIVMWSSFFCLLFSFDVVLSVRTTSVGYEYGWRFDFGRV